MDDKLHQMRLDELTETQDQCAVYSNENYELRKRRAELNLLVSKLEDEIKELKEAAKLLMNNELE